MASDLTPGLVASITMIGTLGATLAAHFFTLRSRRLELESQRTEKSEEAKRISYAGLNATARQFRSTAYDQLISVIHAEGGVSLSEVEEARKQYKDQYARTQMLMPERTMKVAAELNRGISSAYRALVMLNQKYDPTTASILQRWFSDGLSDGVWLLRLALREDLGVVERISHLDDSLKHLENERRYGVDTLPGARSRPRESNGSTPTLQIPGQPTTP